MTSAMAQQATLDKSNKEDLIVAVDKRAKALDSVSGSESTMFIPPYDMIEKHIRIILNDDKTGDEISVSRKLFSFMIGCLLETIDFDERQYRSCNPDVVEAIDRKEFSSGREHFIKVGYFEGRTGSTPVLETWYLARNPDVALAKQAGAVDSAQAQYRLAGASEWREPNPQAVRIVRAWKEALQC